MSDMVSPLLQWLNANPQLAGLATFIISAAESVAVIGTIVPGTITMTAIGTLAGAGVIPLGETIFYAILGAIVGDGISYWLGHYFKDGLRRCWPFKSNPSILEKGEHFVNKYGVMSVFIGRFVGPVRALVPLVAGMLGMRPLLFTIANIASAIGWAPIYMLPGIVLGAASLELPPNIAIHVLMVLFLISLFITLCIWVVCKIFQLITKQTQQFKAWLWNKLKKSQYLHFAIALLKHHDDTKLPGQLFLALVVIGSTLTFTILAIYVKFRGAANIALNQVGYHFYRGIHHPILTKLMINVTFLAQKQVLLPTIALLSLWFAANKKWRLSIHVLMLGLATSGSVFILKHLIKSPRPWGIFQNLETYSMPSGHTTLALVCFFGLAFFLNQSLNHFFRRLTYILAALFTAAVAVSRLYLGAHWFTDVLSSILIGIAILSTIIISYERHEPRDARPLISTLVLILSLCSCFFVYHHFAFAKASVLYTQIVKPNKPLDRNEWWDEENRDIPAYHTNLFGFPADRINIEWTGEMKAIMQTLHRAGWQHPPKRDWISVLHRVADVSSTQYLPLVSPQYLDKPPVLTLTKPLRDKKGLMVLRLWHANRTIQPANDAVWIGVVALIPRTYSGLFRKSLIATENIPNLTIANAKAWQWRFVTVHHTRYSPQTIVLIRPLN